ncbi:hypothetical protein H2198_001518 [Neophaeococcomyces mojaviensis]|uniref:Uncharacterized protein n=1 Tax=Neophaeococcomyces mojaviensis TaxID=3383035 RepID=A0ACC3AGP3_9EURO|nr:hypothetical protein H2198_001518 [Knufia sp. JES_112]
MAATTNTANGPSNFEKELICSICTEILYQPLTILDCLHSFCGSCLKEWFSHQHRKASSSRSSSSSTANPYTCPTCRREVRDVQHNATVSNLLEWFLTEHPDRNRSEQDMQDMREAYKPGENILPKVERRRERRARRDESEAAIRERQMLEEARQRSLRDLEDPSANTLAPPRTGQSRSASRERDERRHRRRERERQRESTATLTIPYAVQDGREEHTRASSSPPVTSPRHPDAVEARQREQRMVHQASLRSLVSASDSGTGTGDSLDEARIMQEILNEGLLGDIDVDALTEAEQDLLAERIAEAYRQRHPRRSTPSSPPQSQQLSSNHPTESDRNHLVVRNEQRRTSHSRQREDTSPASGRRPESRTRQQPSRSQPPPSALARSNSASSSVTISHRRQTSDQNRPMRAVGGSRQSSTERRPPSAPTSHHGSRSDVAVTTSEDPRPSTTTRTHTDPTRSPPLASEAWLQAGGEDRRLQSRTTNSPSRSPRQPHALPVTNAQPQPTTAQLPLPSSIAELDSTAIPAAAPAVSCHEEPSISCFRCQKPDIQYDIHKYCNQCKVSLCMRCYRKGEGCKHWFGFGHAAQTNFENSKHTDEATELPHILTGRQYRKPVASTILETRLSPQTHEALPKSTSSNPQDRLQDGHFCDRCGTFANSQFWLCDFCNDGEWGFCKQCVQTHHCCNHPLLPVAYIPQSPPANLEHLHLNSPISNTLQPNHSNNNSRPTTPRSTASSRAADGHSYDYLSINVNCDNCHNIILPSASRFHCPFHATDFDLCTTCYDSLVHHGRVRRDDGPDGWRKCPAGHRMIILAFEADEDGDGGMRRVVKRDLVGGWKLTEDDMRAWSASHPATLGQSGQVASPPHSPPLSNRGTWTWRDDSSSGRKSTRSRTATLTSANGNLASRFPPDGGFGKRGLVYYSYWPEEGEDGEGELRLPRGAEVGEIEDVNGDWWSGVYCGDIGVMPFGYVRELRA